MGKKRGKKKSNDLADLARRKARAMKVCCSEVWADDVAHRHATYPPPAENTPMQACGSRSCQGRLFPNYYVNDGRCYECHLDRTYARRARGTLPGSSSIVRMG